MDIICKCGHNAEEHEKDNRDCHGGDNGPYLCACGCTSGDVYKIYITEQQARLDTLIAENDKLLEENSRTWCAYCKKEYPRTEDAIRQIREHISTCEKHPMRQVEAERDAAQKEAEERRANFEIMLNRLLSAEQKHAETKAHLNYVLADNAQLRAVLVQFLEWANSEGLIKDFSEIIKKLQTSLNIMGDPREKHD